MLRFHSLTVACVRNAARTGSMVRGKSARTTAHQAVYYLSQSSQVLTPQQQPLPLSPPQININGHNSEPARGKLLPHDDQQCIGGQEDGGFEEEDIKDVQQQQPLTVDGESSLSDVERSRLQADLLWKMKRLSKLGSATATDRAISILEEGRVQGVANLDMYKTVFSNIVETSRTSKEAPRKMEAVLGLMKMDGLQPEVTTYNKILDFYAQVHDVKRASEVYNEMLSAGVAPNQKSLSNIIMAYSWGDSNAMYRAVDELRARKWRASRGAYLGMIAVMGRHEDWHGVLDTIRRMREEEKRPTEAAFVMAFRAASNLRLPDVCKELFQHRVDAGLPPVEYVYVKMMGLFLKDNPEECLEYWRQLVCVNGVNGVNISPNTFHFALKASTKLNNLEETEVILDMMQDQNVACSDDTYLSVLASLNGMKHAEQTQSLEMVEKTFEMISRRGPSPGPRVLVRVGVAYAQVGMWDKALSVFEAILSRGVQISGKVNMSALGWESMMRSQLALGRHTAVKETWTLSTDQAMTVREVKHTRKALEVAVSAAEHLKDADWALRIKDIASDLDHGSEQLDGLVVRVLGRSDRLQEARDILKSWETMSVKNVTRTSRVFERGYQLLLASCERSNETAMAMQLVEEMRSFKPAYSPELSSLPFVLEALTQHGRCAEVVPLFEELVSSENEPDVDPVCYVRVADAACEAEDEGNTVKYCEEARKRGLSPGDRAIAFAEDAADDVVPDVGGGDTDADSEGSAEPPQAQSSGVWEHNALYAALLNHCLNTRYEMHPFTSWSRWSLSQAMKLSMTRSLRQAIKLSMTRSLRQAEVVDDASLPKPTAPEDEAYRPVLS